MRSRKSASWSDAKGGNSIDCLSMRNREKRKKEILSTHSSTRGKGGGKESGRHSKKDISKRIPLQHDAGGDGAYNLLAGKKSKRNTNIFLTTYNVDCFYWEMDS